MDGTLQELNFSGMGWGDPKVECLQCLQSVEVDKLPFQKTISHSWNTPSISLDLSGLGTESRIGIWNDPILIDRYMAYKIPCRIWLCRVPCRFRPLWLCVVLPASCWTCRVRPRQNFVVSWKQLECALVRLCNRPWASLTSLSHFAMSQKGVIQIISFEVIKTSYNSHNFKRLDDSECSLFWERSNNEDVELWLAERASIRGAL